jgi:glucosamine--fructose-6-phosphate aminotransferase (isomerizing)
MCGIVGYVGRRPATEILLGGLKRLEYRGYDSAGIALALAGALHVLKTPGKVQTLADQVYRSWPETLRQAATAGIAHTRWATHGAPTAANAHPHLDQTGAIALVHNGIIENYLELRAHLQARGHEFRSETDTEALAHLVGECYRGDLFQAVCEALRHVRGTLGIAALAQGEPERLVVARRGSPIAIGLGADETLVASDAPALVAHTRQIVFLEDDDVALIAPAGVEIRNVHNVPVTRSVATIDWESGTAEKGGFDHFMLKEICEQPESLANAVRGRIDEAQGTAILAGLGLGPREMADIERVVLMGCGTSLHSAMVAKYFFEELAAIPTDVEQAAEFRYRNPILSPRTLAVAISQSGETADTLAALREAKQKGALVAGICNVVGSTIAREAERGVYLHAGPEIGVASTKAFTSQLAVLLLLTLKIGRGRRLSRQAGMELGAEIRRIPEAVRQVLAWNDRLAALAERFREVRDVFYIGRGCLFPVALEGALKLKEISYIHAEGYHAAELKHGPIALLDEQTPVVALLNDVPGKEKMAGNVKECQARGAPVIAVATAGDESLPGLKPSAIIEAPRTSPLVAAIPTAVILQLLAYHVARLRGCPIDQPRNLAKSVTVE